MNYINLSFGLLRQIPDPSYVIYGNWLVRGLRTVGMRRPRLVLSRDLVSMLLRLLQISW
jgi:hypothetical protein